MRRRIKLAFSDFWPKFNPADNYFTRLLGERFEIELSDQPEFVIFSTFGQNFRRFRTTRIFFTGENWRPNFWDCDYAFTFDHRDDPRHYRLPLYGLMRDPSWLIKRDVDPVQILNSKTLFCNFVYSNPLCSTRNRFFKELSKYKPIASGGRVFNNVGGRVADKLALLRESKFTIAFENESQPGYTTEKLTEPMLAESLPIYWGNPLVDRDFNPKSFINAHDWPNLQAVIERVIEVDRDDELYLEYLKQPWFHGNHVNSYIDRQNVLAQFERIFEDPQTPLALQKAVARFFRIDRLSAAPSSMLRRVKRSTKKLANRLAAL